MHGYGGGIIDADIDFFYVKKAIDVVNKENQLSAKRTINKDHFDTDKKIKNLLEPFSIDYNRTINFGFSFGNVKEEILKSIEKVNPDIIVLGKRKSSPLKIIGDNITDFVLKNFFCQMHRYSKNQRKNHRFSQHLPYTFYALLGKFGSIRALNNL